MYSSAIEKDFGEKGRSKNTEKEPREKLLMVNDINELIIQDFELWKILPKLESL